MKTYEDFRNYGLTFEEIPIELRDKDVCYYAVKHSGFDLQFVPPQLRTLEICRLAVENNEDAIDFVSKKMLIKMFQEGNDEWNRL